MERTSLLARALAQPPSAIPYFVGQALREEIEDRAIIETASEHFNLSEFAEDGHCVIRYRSHLHQQISTEWLGPDDDLHRRAENVWAEVEWQSNDLEVLSVAWQNGFHEHHRHWIVAQDRSIAESFLAAVCEWCHEVRGQVLVFNGGCWEKSRELYDAIQSTTFENLVLAGDLKTTIEQQAQQFLASREEYERYGVPWKRGILLIGPAGNGKTHCVKALVNRLDLPCLYVRSLKNTVYETEAAGIQQVFYRARKSAPCILVLEDLDALITPENRSFFLNELDGFADNTGIITLATTNHPDKLDASLLERPSRFDVKYHFDLPAADERREYISLWDGRLHDEMRIDDDRYRQIVQATDGFSFAYIKELFLSSIMRWIEMRSPGAFADILVEQAASLRLQMRSASESGS